LVNLSREADSNSLRPEDRMVKLPPHRRHQQSIRVVTALQFPPMLEGLDPQMLLRRQLALISSLHLFLAVLAAQLLDRKGHHHPVVIIQAEQIKVDQVHLRSL
jgi:hypothetical protein